MATFQDYLQQDYLAQDYLEQDYLGENEEDVVEEPDPPVASSITISPDSLAGLTGNSASISAVVKDQYGAVFEAEIEFSSDLPLIASVVEGPNGKATVNFLAAGEATITATSGELSDSITATVTADSPPVFGGASSGRLARVGFRVVRI